MKHVNGWRVGRPLVPKSVRWAVVGILILAVLSLEGVWAILDPAYRSFVGNQLNESTAGALSASELDSTRSVALVIVGVGSFGVAMSLCWLAFKIRAGRRWARLVVTAVIATGLFYSLRNLWTAGLYPQPIGRSVELMDLLSRVAVLGLLWGPENARIFFERRIGGDLGKQASEGVDA